jgi:tRNA A37 threonylcarbamoyladenosine biosynthesis protein TsaE
MRRLLRSACAAETEALGYAFGALAVPGDVLCLVGGIGVGKSCFARGFVRAAVGDAQRIVASPTFMLVNEHRAADAATAARRAPVIDAHHLDLYRLSTGTSRADDESLAALDLPRLFTQGASVVEWAERLGTRAGEGPCRWRGGGSDVDALTRGGRTLWIDFRHDVDESDDDEGDAPRLLVARDGAASGVRSARAAAAWATAAVHECEASIARSACGERESSCASESYLYR